MAGVMSQLIDGSYLDTETGERLQAPTRNVTIARDLSGMETTLVEGVGLDGKLAVVCDYNTHDALGERVIEALSAQKNVKTVNFGDSPHADMATAKSVIAETSDCDGIVAVGSGTINDLCKYAAAQQEKPYAVFATAPSMNGYTSVNAAITVDGLKKTLSARGAVGVFMDAEVLAKSPGRLIMSGFGDSICRSTAQTDWYLSHKLFGTPYRSTPYDILKDDEKDLFADPEAIRRRDPDAIMKLSRVLTLSGFGMTICGGSAPASQGEHMISHFMDMLPSAGWPGAYHGEQIAVTTITSAGIQETLLNGKVPELCASETTRENVDATFGTNLGGLCWAEYDPKRVTAQNLDEINHKLTLIWGDLQRDLAQIHVKSATIRETLAAAGAPTKPAAIGLSNEYYDTATEFARTIRNRFCFLDIACDSSGPGILEIARQSL